MDRPQTDIDQDFRLRVRRWLTANLPANWLSGHRKEPEAMEERFAFRREWHRRLHAGGWLGLQWPKAYGGQGLSLNEQLIFNEEAMRVEAPSVADWVGVELIGPSLLHWGTEAQKSRYLPRILSADDVWCQGWSEPDAGSDLINISTTATETNDGFVLDGHKRWTSWAQFADHCVVLARTGDPAQRHRTLSCFIVPIPSPGLSIKPIAMANGQAEENDLFLDQVTVPREAMLGPLNGGWRVVLTAMECARGTATVMRTMELRAMQHQLLQMAGTGPAGRLRGRMSLV